MASLENFTMFKEELISASKDSFCGAPAKDHCWHQLREGSSVDEAFHNEESKMLVTLCLTVDKMVGMWNLKKSSWKNQIDGWMVVAKGLGEEVVEEMEKCWSNFRLED